MLSCHAHFPNCVLPCAKRGKSEKWKHLPLWQYTRSPSSGNICQNRNPHLAVSQQPLNEHICSLQFSYLLNSQVQSSDRSCRDVNLKQIESWPLEIHKEEIDMQINNARHIAISTLTQFNLIKKMFIQSLQGAWKDSRGKQFLANLFGWITWKRWGISRAWRLGLWLIQMCIPRWEE